MTFYTHDEEVERGQTEKKSCYLLIAGCRTTVVCNICAADSLPLTRLSHYFLQPYQIVVVCEKDIPSDRTSSLDKLVLFLVRDSRKTLGPVHGL